MISLELFDPDLSQDAYHTNNHKTTHYKLTYQIMAYYMPVTRLLLRY